jgi:hypothetical protein
MLALESVVAQVHRRRQAARRIRGVFPDAIEERLSELVRLFVLQKREACADPSSFVDSWITLARSEIDWSAVQLPSEEIERQLKMRLRVEMADIKMILKTIISRGHAQGQ